MFATSLLLLCKGTLFKSSSNMSRQLILITGGTSDDEADAESAPSEGELARQAAEDGEARIKSDNNIKVFGGPSKKKRDMCGPRRSQTQAPPKRGQKQKMAHLTRRNQKMSKFGQGTLTLAVPRTYRRKYRKRQRPLIPMQLPRSRLLQWLEQ